MAKQDDLLGVIKKVKQGDVLNNQADSEALMSLFGANINALIESNVKDFSFSYVGYFKVTSISEAIDGIVRLDDNYLITGYHLTIDDCGSSGNTSFNIGVYDQDGTFQGNLFSTPVQIGSGVNSGVVVGKDGTSNINENNGAIVVNNGTQDAGIELLKGYKLKAHLNSNGANAKTLRFNLKVKVNTN